MEVNYIIDNVDEFIASVKINNKGKTKQQIYRESVDKWVKCLKYAERLMKCVNNMNKAFEDLSNKK
ncbi:MAG: hypothetical protein WC141_09180 [Arcobacteraceae bacterium]